MARRFGFLSPQKEPTDEEFVKRIRKYMTGIDRWKNCFIAMHVCILLAIFGLAFAFSSLLADRMNNAAQNAWAQFGFCLGIILGIKIGLLLLAEIVGLLRICIGLRSERLLLRYYDALMALKNGEIGKPADEASPSV